MTAASLDGFRPETCAAVGAVAEALELARRGVGADERTLKAARDLVTATDVAVEDAVRRTLTEAFPHAVVGEEGGGDVPRDARGYWLVDPICGTRNFASGIPLWCVNVAFVERERVTIGVVGDPSTGALHVAETGNGAWALGGDERHRLAVSDDSQTVVVEDSHADPNPARRDRAAASLARVVRAFRWDTRSFSTTLALAYVAAGRVAAYGLFWTSALHVAAGSVVATEAGAVVSDIDGQPWTVKSDSIVASANDTLHGELLALFRPA